jgi:hypothetical protein
MLVCQANRRCLSVALPGNRLTGEVPQELCYMDLNQDIFDEDVDFIVEKTLDEVAVGGSNRQRRRRQRRRRRRIEHVTRRDGCTSIACPAGSRSVGGHGTLFPCAEFPAIARF